MKLQLTVDRTAALLAGHDHYGPQSLEFDPATLPIDLRRELVTCPEEHGVTRLTSMVDGLYRHGDEPWPSIAAATPDAIINCLQARLAIRALRAEQAAAAREAKAQEEAALIARVQAALPALTAHVEACEARGSAEPFSVDTIGLYRYQPGQFITTRGVGSLPQCPARETFDTLAARLSTVDQHAIERRRAQREADEAAALQRLRTWTTTHGSERAQLLLEEQHPSWATIASDEYLQAHIPEGYAVPPLVGDTWEDRERTKPTAKDIYALRVARFQAAASEGVLTDPSLACCVEQESSNDEYGDSTLTVLEKYAAVLLTIVSPTGATMTVVHRMD